jgi:hypothetical protein
VILVLATMELVAYDMHTYEMHTYEMHADEMHAMRGTPMRGTTMRYMPVREARRERQSALLGAGRPRTEASQASWAGKGIWGRGGLVKDENCSRQVKPRRRLSGANHP